jgi:hypothetical protein
LLTSDSVMSGYQTFTHERNYGCRLREFIYREHRCVTIENELLRILICADKGADILEFLYKPIDLDFMWRSRLGLRRASHFRPSSPLETGHFREYFAGGWYEMLPNGPVPCAHRGAPFGYHGEATLLPWDYEITVDEPERIELRFTVRLMRIPLFVEKTVRLERGSATLYLHERILNESEQTVEVLWGHHPTFGPPFLAGNCRVYLPACRISVAEKVPLDARIAPAQIADWPFVKGRNGEMIDLSFLPGPEAKTHDFVQLGGLADGWFALVNPETEAGFALRWDIEKFPVLGYWQLFRGGADYPWYGMNYLAAFEPASSLPSLAEAASKGEALSITPGVPLETAIEATAFRRPLEVRWVDYGGTIS